tara:strand:- start:4925 stop:5122 length:198 start_codon:yes stop_codon:yes gene_type:complete
MNKYEELNQTRFEHMLNLLIVYKQENKEKDVYLSEHSIKEALQWFQKNISSLSDRGYIDPSILNK